MLVIAIFGVCVLVHSKPSDESFVVSRVSAIKSKSIETLITSRVVYFKRCPFPSSQRPRRAKEARGQLETLTNVFL